jgi:hypothetical protein
MTDAVRGRLAEMERSSQDRLLVHNILDKPMKCQWGPSMTWELPSSKQDRGYGPGNFVVPRYIARKVCQEIIDEYYNLLQDGDIKAENARRAKAGQLPMTKWAMGEQENFQQQAGHYSRSEEEDNKLRAEIIIGVVEKYGLDTVTIQEKPEKPSLKNAHEVFFEKMNKKVNLDDYVQKAGNTTTAPVKG